MDPNPEEVDGVKYVTLKELQEQMKPESGLLWSPWFRIIVQRWLPAWSITHLTFSLVYTHTCYPITPCMCRWADLKTTLTTDKHVDVSKVHAFGPPSEHLGLYHKPSTVGASEVKKQVSG